MRSMFNTDTYTVMIPFGHPERISFAEILATIYQRYSRPLVISETGSHGEFRPGWWELVLSEIEDARKSGIPISGVCAYPILDKPSALHFLWPQSGIWDFDPVDPSFRRIPHIPTLDIIKKYITKSKKANTTRRKRVNSKDAHDSAKTKQLLPELLYYTR